MLISSTQIRTAFMKSGTKSALMGIIPRSFGLFPRQDFSPRAGARSKCPFSPAPGELEDIETRLADQDMTFIHRSFAGEEPVVFFHWLGFSFGQAIRSPG